MIRTRFAPSPTGFVHIGSLRTALFSFLFARHNKGTLILRIEDTDQNRLVEGALENLLKVMKAVGIEFDEGFYLAEDGTIGERGEYGPYLQSRRLDKYHKVAKQLIDEHKAYYCFCSQERLEELKKEQIALKKPPMYDRLCRNLPAAEIQKKLDEFHSQNKNPVIRFAVPQGSQTVVNDIVYGTIIYDNKVLDDQVIIKSDGFPTYHLAVVVDDHLMKVTHVIRGDEWLPSTPKHLLIYQALGWEPTQFAHLPLILNPDKSKLSKRHGDSAVEECLKKGYLPEALINFVALLGWNPKTDRELFSMEELISEFDLAKINKSGAVFDGNKLDWFNSQYIRKLTPDELAQKLLPYWKQSIGADIIGQLQAKNPQFLSAIAALEQDRLKKLSEIGERTAYFFKQPEYHGQLLIWKKCNTTITKKVLSDLLVVFDQTDPANLTKDALETKIKDFITRGNYDNGTVLWPLRVALTGLEKSPPPFDVAAILALGPGKQEIINRLRCAIAKL